MSDKLYSPIIYDPISKIYYKQELNTHVGIVLNAQQQFVNKLIKQRDQYKAENEKLRERNKKLEKRCNQKVRRNVRGGLQQMKIEDLESKCDGMKTENEQYKAERDTLIDDLSWYKANVSRLERELKKKNMDADRLGYRWRDSHNEAKTYKSLLSEFSQHIGNKPSSSTYKYFRAKLDELGIKEGE